MQQAIYNSSAIQAAKTSATTATATRRVSLARHIAQRWDIAGVLTLMVSSAAYGVYAIAHVL